MKYLIIIAFVVFNSSENKWCVCPPRSVKVNYENSSLIFNGLVIAVDTIKQFDENLPKGSYRELHLATIKANKIYKGKVSSNTIKVITRAGYGDCGYGFFPAKNCMVYAQLRNYPIIDSTILPSLDVIVSTKEFYYTDVCKGTTTDWKKEETRIRQYVKQHKN